MPPRAPDPDSDKYKRQPVSEVGEAGAPTIRVPNVPLDENDMPFCGKERMPANRFIITFASSRWFRPGGRYLTRGEIAGIVRVMYAGEDISSNLWRVIKSVEDDWRQSTLILETLADEDREDLCIQVAYHFKELVTQDLEARKTYELLKGFVGKVTTLEFGSLKESRPIIDNHVLQEGQLYTIYALFNWCKDVDGNKVNELDAMQIIREGYGYTVRKNRVEWNLYKKLTDPDHELYKLVAPAIQEPRHETFFRRKAQQWHVNSSDEGTLYCRAWPYPPFTDPASQSDLTATTSGIAELALTATASNITGSASTATASDMELVAATEAIGALAMTATAPSSREYTDSGLRQRSPFYPDMVDIPSDTGTEAEAESEAEAEPKEALPAPSGGSGKTKGRAREESSSESPPGKGLSAVAKGKRPQKKTHRG